MMNFEELEELLYTDGEVREQMETRQLRVRAQRALRRGYQVLEPVEVDGVSEPDDAVSENFAPALYLPVLGPFQSGQPQAIKSFYGGVDRSPHPPRGLERIVVAT